MTAQIIHRNRNEFPDCDAVDCIAGALEAIHQTSPLMTDARIGRLLGGKSEDSAYKYRRGDTTMSAVTFLRGAKEWGAAFADPALALAGYRLVPLAGGQSAPVDAVARLAAIVASLAQVSNGEWTPEKLAAHKGPLDDLQTIADEFAALRGVA